MTSPINLWKPLQEKNEIRLLELQPGSFSDIIKCNFIHVRLSQKPQYEALSYMWGSEVILKPIELDGKNHQVRENLWLALKHLRRPYTTRVLWADAVCINQPDNKERTHQVSQMGDIYSHASTVCVWLGDSDESSERAIEFLKLESTLKSVMSRVIQYPSCWEDVARLCQRPYWSRLWVTQEIILAKNLVIYCGNSTLPWELLRITLQTFQNRMMLARQDDTRNVSPVDDLPFAQTMKKSLAATIIGRREHHKEPPNVEAADVSGPYVLSLIHLVLDLRQSQCRDPRDKIYALLGIASMCCQIAVPVDYHCSINALCDRVIEHQLSNHYYLPDLFGMESISKEFRKVMMEGELGQSNFMNNSQFGHLADLKSDLLYFLNLQRK